MDGRWHRGHTLAKYRRTGLGPSGGMLPGMEAGADRRIVGGRGFDLAYLFGSSAAGVLVGGALLLRPRWIVPAWWIFTVLADGPHLLITVTRAYVDPRDRRRLGWALWLVPLWILVGPIALGVGRVTGSSAPWTLFLAGAAVWSTYHFIRQHSGLLAICERRAGAGRVTARIDGLFLQGALWTMTFLYRGDGAGRSGPCSSSPRPSIRARGPSPWGWGSGWAPPPWGGSRCTSGGDEGAGAGCRCGSSSGRSARSTCSTSSSWGRGSRSSRGPPTSSRPCSASPS